jgi:hypothetical protein
MLDYVKRLRQEEQAMGTQGGKPGRLREMALLMEQVMNEVQMWGVIYGELMDSATAQTRSRSLEGDG